jgi:hypothetical protein
LKARRDLLEKNRDASMNALRLQLDSFRTRLARATDLFVDGTLDRSVFTSKQNEILLEQAKTKERLAELERGGLDWVKRTETTVELAKRPSIQYKSASPEKKRQFAKTLLSNLAVSQKNVEVTLAPPFNLVAEREKNTAGGPYRGTCRTWDKLLRQLLKHFTEQPAN